MTPRDTLVVASLVPPRDRRDARRFLTAVAIAGPGVSRATLTSASTQRDGLVTLADLAPTIVDRAGAAIPDDMKGNVIRAERRSHALDTVATLERDVIHASAVRGPVLRGIVVAGSVLLVLALLTILSGRGRVRHDRVVPTTWRAVVDTGLIAIVAAPTAMMLEPLFATGGLASTAIVVAVSSIVVAAIARGILGSRRAVIALLAVAVGVVFVDLLLGTPLAERSPLSYLLTEGARFHGIGNEAMGVLIAGTLLTAAARLDAGGSTRRVAAVAIDLAAVAAVMALPQLGAKFGSVPAAVPSFALFVVLSSGGRPDRRTLLAVAIVTVFAAGVIVALNELMASGSHVAGAVGGGAGEILGRKAGAAGRLLALSYWIAGIVAGAGSVGLLAWRRPSLLGRGLWGRPAARRAVVCCGIAGAGALVANDAGVTAAAWVSLLAGSAVMSALLVPADP